MIYVMVPQIPGDVKGNKNAVRRRLGAVDETRTRDLHLGKVALYQLSYYRMYMVRAKRLELICPWDTRS